MTKKSLAGFPFSVYTQFFWNDCGSMGSVITGLKNGRGSRAYNYLSEGYLKHRVSLGQLPQRAVLVPAPPSKKYKTDHALDFSRALEKRTGYPIVRGLQRVDGLEQKGLTREKRRQIKLNCTLGVPPGLTIIFVDDLITTGATARAAWLAFQKPSAFEAWTLACRPSQALV